MPIVNVRFDAPYRQIASSLGDERAPTWGQDDALYTGKDDSSSFGLVRINAIAFGKLDGGDPEDLKGSTISSMDEYPDSERPTSYGTVSDSADQYVYAVYNNGHFENGDLEALVRDPRVGSIWICTSSTTCRSRCRRQHSSTETRRSWVPRPMSYR